MNKILVVNNNRSISLKVFDNEKLLNAYKEQYSDRPVKFDVIDVSTYSNFKSFLINMIENIEKEEVPTFSDSDIRLCIINFKHDLPEFPASLKNIDYNIDTYISDVKKSL